MPDIYTQSFADANKDLSSLIKTVQELISRVGTLERQAKKTTSSSISGTQGEIKSIKQLIKQIEKEEKLKKKVTKAEKQKAGLTRDDRYKVYKKDLEAVSHNWNVINARQTTGVKLMQNYHQATRMVQGRFENILERLFLWGSATSLMYTTMLKIKRTTEDLIKLEHERAQIQKVTGRRVDLSGVYKSNWVQAVKYGESILDITKATKIWVQQGRGELETMRLMNTTMLTRVATNMSLQKSVENLTASMAAFNIEAKYTTRISNEWMAVQSKHVTTAEDLANAVKRLGPVIAQTGGTPEQLMGYISAVKKQTMETGVGVANALKTSFGRVFAPENVKWLRDIGVETKNVYNRNRDLFSILSDIARLWHSGNWQTRASMLMKMSGVKLSKEQAKALEVEPMAVAKKVGGLRRFQQLIALIVNWDEALQATSDALTTLGMGAEASGIELNTLQRRFAKVREQAHKLGLAIGNALILQSPATKIIASGLESVLKVMNKVAESPFFGTMVRITAQTLAWVAALKALFVVLGEINMLMIHNAVANKAMTSTWGRMAVEMPVSKIGYKLGQVRTGKLGKSAVAGVLKDVTKEMGTSEFTNMAALLAGSEKLGRLESGKLVSAARTRNVLQKAQNKLREIELQRMAAATSLEAKLVRLGESEYGRRLGINALYEKELNLVMALQSGKIKLEQIDLGYWKQLRRFTSVYKPQLTPIEMREEYRGLVKEQTALRQLINERKLLGKKGFMEKYVAGVYAPQLAYTKAKPLEEGLEGLIKREKIVTEQIKRTNREMGITIMATSKLGKATGFLRGAWAGVLSTVKAVSTMILVMAAIQALVALGIWISKVVKRNQELKHGIKMTSDVMDDFNKRMEEAIKKMDLLGSKSSEFSSISPMEFGEKLRPLLEWIFKQKQIRKDEPLYWDEVIKKANEYGIAVADTVEVHKALQQALGAELGLIRKQYDEFYKGIKKVSDQLDAMRTNLVTGKSPESGMRKFLVFWRKDAKMLGKALDEVFRTSKNAFDAYGAVASSTGLARSQIQSIALRAEQKLSNLEIWGKAIDAVVDKEKQEKLINEKILDLRANIAKQIGLQSAIYNLPPVEEYVNKYGTAAEKILLGARKGMNNQKELMRAIMTEWLKHQRELAKGNKVRLVELSKIEDQMNKGLLDTMVRHNEIVERTIAYNEQLQIALSTIKDIGWELRSNMWKALYGAVKLSDAFGGNLAKSAMNLARSNVQNINSAVASNLVDIQKQARIVAKLRVEQEKLASAREVAIYDEGTMNDLLEKNAKALHKAEKKLDSMNVNYGMLIANSKKLLNENIKLYNQMAKIDELYQAGQLYMQSQITLLGTIDSVLASQESNVEDTTKIEELRNKLFEKRIALEQRIADYKIAGASGEQKMLIALQTVDKLDTEILQHKIQNLNIEGKARKKLDKELKAMQSEQVSLAKKIINAWKDYYTTMYSNELKLAKVRGATPKEQFRLKERMLNIEYEAGKKILDIERVKSNMSDTVYKAKLAELEVTKKIAMAKYAQTTVNDMIVKRQQDLISYAKQFKDITASALSDLWGFVDAIMEGGDAWKDFIINGPLKQMGQLYMKKIGENLADAIFGKEKTMLNLGTRLQGHTTWVTEDIVNATESAAPYLGNGVIDGAKVAGNVLKASIESAALDLSKMNKKALSLSTNGLATPNEAMKRAQAMVERVESSPLAKALRPGGLNTTMSNLGFNLSSKMNENIEKYWSNPNNTIYPALRRNIENSLGQLKGAYNDIVTRYGLYETPKPIVLPKKKAGTNKGAVKSDQYYLPPSSGLWSTDNYLKMQGVTPNVPKTAGGESLLIGTGGLLMSKIDIEKFKKQIMKEEGLVLKTYRGPGGMVLTGVGHSLGPNAPLNQPISRNEAMALLDKDIQQAIKDAASVVPNFAELDATRQSVLADMAFSHGKEGLSKYKKMIQAVQERDYSRAADEMMDSLWARQYTTRASKLADMMRYGATGFAPSDVTSVAGVASSNIAKVAPVMPSMAKVDQAVQDYVDRSAVTISSNIYPTPIFPSGIISPTTNNYGLALSQTEMQSVTNNLNNAALSAGRLADSLSLINGVSKETIDKARELNSAYDNSINSLNMATPSNANAQQIKSFWDTEKGGKIGDVIKAVGAYGGGAIGASVAKGQNKTGEYVGTLSSIGGAIGTAVGGPLGGAIGSMVFGAIGGLIGKNKKQEQEIHDDIHAIRTNTDQMARMTAGLYNMPSTFNLPGAVTRQYGDINITIHTNGDSGEIEDAVYRGLRRGLSRG